MEGKNHQLGESGRSQTGLPIQLAEYTMAPELQHLSAFKWWLPHILAQ
jgi:hypothetical protein